MYRKSLLLALALALGAANAQDATDTTTETTETVVEVELTGLDHLLRLVEGGAVVMVQIDEKFYQLNADGSFVDAEGNISELTGEIVVMIGETEYVLAGALENPGMLKVTVTLANGVTQTIAMPAALNRVAHGLHKTRPAPESEKPQVEKPVIEPELPAQATDRRPADAGRPEGAGRPTELPAAAAGRGK